LNDERAAREQNFSLTPGLDFIERALKDIGDMGRARQWRQIRQTRSQRSILPQFLQNPLYKPSRID